MKSTKKPTIPLQERDMSILTDRQRTAYLLRLQKMTYKKIGERMGITPNAVSELIHHAERRFREYDRYNDARQRNNVIVDFPMTRGELLFTLSALRLLEAELEKGIQYRPSSDWAGRLPYEHSVVRSLEERLQLTLYGRNIHKSPDGSKDGEPGYNDTGEKSESVCTTEKQGDST